jgi:hypothetical protein
MLDRSGQGAIQHGLRWHAERLITAAGIYTAIGTVPFPTNQVKTLP